LIPWTEAVLIGIGLILKLEHKIPNLCVVNYVPLIREYIQNEIMKIIYRHVLFSLILCLIICNTMNCLCPPSRYHSVNIQTKVKQDTFPDSSPFEVLTREQLARVLSKKQQSMFPTQKSGRAQLKIQGGGETQEFEVYADEYDVDRHFFLSHYNRNQFEGALTHLPRIHGLFRITRMQVWVANDSIDNKGVVRDIIALSDLGEGESIVLHNPEKIKTPVVPFAPDLNGKALPENRANNLYDRLMDIDSARGLNDSTAALGGDLFQMTQTKDFEKVNARLLDRSEYSYHPELGFLSVKINIRPDQVLGVSYQYTYKGEVYTVGELTKYFPPRTDAQEVLFVKLLKSSEQRADLPIWDLMMKNIYGIGAYQVGREDFKLDVFYDDLDEGNKRFLTETNLSSEPLIQVFNLDNLNHQGDPLKDGVFDFIPGLTINTQTGRVMFPVLEPFGSSLAMQISDPALREKFVYQELYDSTITQESKFAKLNRFKIAGSFKTSVSSMISLGAFNILEGSIKVSARRRELVEGKEYVIDYNIGRIKILNEAIFLSGTPINISINDEAFEKE